MRKIISEGPLKIKPFFSMLITAAMLTVCIAGSVTASASEKSASIAEGQVLPEFKMETSLTPEMMQYLGLESGPMFTLKQIRSNLVIIEALSALCEECHKNAPRVNKLFNIISGDSDLNGNVKILGIALGNDARMVEAYKKTFNVKFPVIADPDDNISRQLGHLATPSLIVADSKGTVLYVHQGLIDDLDMILDVIRTFHVQ
jgi:hypothetical protein